MNYKLALEYMYSRLPMFSRIGVQAYKKDLNRTIALCEHLDHPEKKFKSIHIAGTNGKGSVSHMLASILQEHGYKVGLYVSPHYRDFRERIKINGQYISKKYVSSFVTKHKNFIEFVEPSFFEMTVSMAFDYFAKEKVDYAIIETGLGGRLDSTNVITPELSVITNISWDHMDVLGDTLEKIAGEKAGIIKPDIPVIVGRHQTGTDSVFIMKAKEMNSEIIFAENDCILLKDKEQIQVNNQFKFKPDLLGPYQLENYRTAIAASEFLNKRNIIPIEQNLIKKALEKVASNTNMIGRWQWLDSNEKILADSAHNEDGIKYLTNWLNMQEYKNLHIVCGFVKDKDLQHVFELLPKEAKYYFTQAKIPRALKADELNNQAKAFYLNGKSYKTVSSALRSAKKNYQQNDLIVICGSIFVVAEII